MGHYLKALKIDSNSDKVQRVLIVRRQSGVPLAELYVPPYRVYKWLCAPGAEFVVPSDKHEIAILTDPDVQVKEYWDNDIIEWLGEML